MPAHGDRKRDHLELALSPDCETGSNGLSRYRLIPEALPEMSLDEVHLTTPFLGRKLSFPFLAASMTGGQLQDERCNPRLARHCQRHKVALALGSMRVAVEDASRIPQFDVRSLAPEIPLLGNTGAWQLKSADFRSRLVALVKDLDLDGMFVHVNVVQELVQPEGDKDFRGALDAVRAFIQECPVPVFLKGVGGGLASRYLPSLLASGLYGLDVAGAGGTSFAWIEGERAQRPMARATAMDLDALGIPTADLLVHSRQMLSSLPDTGVTHPLIASGGLRTGMDLALSLALGADLTSSARPLLAALSSGDDVLEHLLTYYKTALSMICLSCGARTPNDLRGRVTKAE